MDTAIKPGMTTNVGVPERIVSVLGGALLLYNGLSKRNLSLVKTIAAGYLVFRGATGHCPVYHGVGKTEVDYRPPNVNIKTALTVNRPRHAVYAFWRKLENLPLFMKHLDSVKEINEKLSEWKLRIPGGLGTVSWKSEIVKEEPGDFLSWHSISDAGIENAGKIEFRDAGKFGTEIHVVISYHAPLGIVGEKAARIFNPMFETAVREDVRNFKRYIETGEVPVTEGQPSGREKVIAETINV